MKLSKKIHFIVLPVMLGISVVSSFIYYNLTREQLIDKHSQLLYERLNNFTASINQNLQYTRIFISQQIASKEITKIINEDKINNQLITPYVTEFIKSFNQNDKVVVNDFSIFNYNKQKIIHINRTDPFSKATIKEPVNKFIDNLNTEIKTKYYSKWHFYAKNSEYSNFPSINIVKFFSPYYLNSKDRYSTKDTPYFAQVSLNDHTFHSEFNALLVAYDGYLRHNLILNNKFSDSLKTSTVILNKDKMHGLAYSIESEIFSIDLRLAPKYFDKELEALAFKLIVVTLLFISIFYGILVHLINKQIINPVITLSQNIKSTKVSSDMKLKELKTDDEVNDLNESFSELIVKVNELAQNDSLTGLANRSNFNQKLSQLANKIDDKKLTALLYIDLDHFKDINDTYGHSIGDEVLKTFGLHLKQSLRNEDSITNAENVGSIARLGGDEFVVLLKGISSTQDIKKIAQRICNLFENGFSLENNNIFINASIGIAFSNKKNIIGSELLHQADSAMYLAKRTGRNNYQFFSSAIEKQVMHEREIENTIKDSLSDDCLKLMYMPSYNATTLQFKGFEVLLRCPALMKNNIGPDIFIPIAERSDLIIKLDLWVAENALCHLQILNIKYKFNGFYSINISSRSLRTNIFNNKFKSLLKKFNIDPSQVELELTETCLMPDDKQAIASLKQLKSLGINIALDDFGTGYTSIGQLMNYPLDTLKIDRAFVLQLDSISRNKKPTLNIIYELTKIYQLAVIVEGIETQAQLDHIKGLGDEIIVQGFYFSTPLSWEKVIAGEHMLVNKIAV